MKAMEHKARLDFISQNPEQTALVGDLLGGLCAGGEIIRLDGVLGAGKTVLAQGIAKGLGIVETVTSPTFTLLKEYRGRLVLNHFDFYRLEGADRSPELEFAEYQGEGAVCVIEWAEHAPAFLPQEHLHVELRPVSPTKRAVVLTGHGERYEDLVRRFRAVAFR